MCLNCDAHFGVNTAQERDVSTCPPGRMRPLDALRSRRQQLGREDVTVYVRRAVVRCEEKASTLVPVVALLVLGFLRSKRYGKHNTSTDSGGAWRHGRRRAAEADPSK